MPDTMQIFLEVMEGLPRQGPGNRACAERALALCADLPEAPRILDLGCGAGGQTLHVAELTGGSVVAVDSHVPFIDALRERAASRGMADRIEPLAGDIGTLQLPPHHFDLAWSEGALYNVGLERAFTLCRGLLKPRGYLAFTDAVWRTSSPPAEVRAMFEEDYPTMGRASDVLGLLDRFGFEVIEHFTLPDEAWWDDFYTPMEQRIEALRAQYAADAEALEALSQIAEEPAFHRKHAAHYAYEFFVAREAQGSSSSN